MNNNKKRPTAEAIEKMADNHMSKFNLGKHGYYPAKNSFIAGFKEALDQMDQQPFKPCGEGDNICNCKSAEECGYLQQPVSTGDRLKIEDLHMKHIEETGLGRPMLYSEMDVKQFTINFAKAYAAQEVEAAKHRWIPAIEKPKFNGEYICAYDLEDEDGGLVTGSLDYDIDTDAWTDLQTGQPRKCVFYQELPAAPQQEGGEG